MIDDHIDDDKCTRHCVCSDIYARSRARLQGALGSVVMLCLAVPGVASSSNMQWEVVMQRTVVVEPTTPRLRRKYYSLVCLRRQPRPQDQVHKPVGIGATFERDLQGCYRVTSIHAGGSADESGQVVLGDLLFSVNGLLVKDRTTDSVIQLIKGAPGTRTAIVLVTDGPTSSRSHPGQDAFRFDVFSVVPKIGQEPSELVAIILGAQGLSSNSMHPAVFCQLRMIDLSGEGELREELIGVDKAGLALGMRVIKSRLLIERESLAGQGSASEGALGTISFFDSSVSTPGTCTVLWDSGEVREHSIGKDGEYDLEIAPQMTTISTSLADTRWDNALTLRVRDPLFAALEISIWDRENYLGEILVHVDTLHAQEGRFQEQTRGVTFDEHPTASHLQLACAWFSSRNRAKKTEQL
jgi:hypothetical protein